MDGLENNQGSSFSTLMPFLSASGPTLVTLWKAQMEWCARVNPIGEDPQTSVSKMWEILRQLDAMKSLDQNWDSYGSDAPTPLAVGTARALIFAVLTKAFGLVGDRAVPSGVAPLSGAGVQVEWRGAGNAIEVEIGSHGSFGYLLIQGTGDQRQFTERDAVPESDILNLINSVIL